MRGVEHGLYKLPVNDKELLKLYCASTPNSTSVNSFNFPTCNNAYIVNGVLWHDRLGHLHFVVVQKVFTNSSFKLKSDSM